MQILLKNDLNPKPSIKSINNQILSVFYEYYKNFAQNREIKGNSNDLTFLEKLILFLKEPDIKTLESLKFIPQKFSGIPWNGKDNYIKIPVSENSFLKDLDPDIKPILTVFLKNGSKKEISVIFNEVI